MNYLQREKLNGCMKLPDTMRAMMLEAGGRFLVEKVEHLQ